jgi:hypothetical protein
MNATFKRTRLWIDPSLQFGLLVRLALYLVSGSLVLLHIAFLIEVLGNLPVVLNRGVLEFYTNFIARQVPLLIALLAVLPLFLYDMVKFSHRFAGPLYRFRKTLEAMAAGKPVQPVKIRKDDLLRDIVPPINAVIRRWNDLTSADAPPVAQEVPFAEASEEEDEPATAATAGTAS